MYLRDLKQVARDQVESVLADINLVNDLGWCKNLHDLGLRITDAVEGAVEAIMKIRLGYGERRIGGLWLQAGQKVPRNMDIQAVDGFGTPCKVRDLPDDTVICFTLIPGVVDIRPKEPSAIDGCEIRNSTDGLLLDRVPEGARLLIPPKIVVYSEKLASK